MAVSDLELIQKAQAGDSQAMDTLLERHEQQVYRFGLRMCGNEEDAREILQETLTAAFRNLHEFRGEAQLSTWLYQIARNFCTRSRRPTAGEPAEMVSLDVPDARKVLSQEELPDARLHARQIGHLLEVALLSLPESYREVVVLRDVEGLTAEEAAKVVGIEVGALKSRLHRARAELRAQLSSLLGDPTRDSEACPELAKELSRFASEEQDIDQATCARIEEHLRSCPRCESACETLKRTVSLCRRIPGDEVPAPVRSAVRRALVALAPEYTRT